MFKFITNIFDDNAKDIKKYGKVVEKINSLEGEISALSDTALQNKTGEFRGRLEKGEDLQAILPE
ncbi:MAG: hypothetical protein RR396_02015, partial [Clostridiales bacterium]